MKIPFPSVVFFPLGYVLGEFHKPGDFQLGAPFDQREFGRDETELLKGGRATPIGRRKHSSPIEPKRKKFGLSRKWRQNNNFFKDVCIFALFFVLCLRRFGRENLRNVIDVARF
jgi:hypothetical protein